VLAGSPGCPGHDTPTSRTRAAPLQQGEVGAAGEAPAASPPEKAEPAEAEEEKKKWDVGDPEGQPGFEVPLDLAEGTWMSLDVSPEGDEVAFDLLGDLYSVPIAGGPARALTSGMAWDMQPRYSPDGRSIAFTSDRGGGDNLWIMGRDGANPRQVTKESFRLLNSPAWSPDGEFLVARKHFTSRRSAGAGEMWLYHRSGGEGLQMTVKPNDQKDAGEPAFSPDGRYLYFSQDTTPGAVFQYNKDPNGQIYVIQRLDRRTGRLEPFVTGPGGAVRPTPSPDGRSLAFIRRLRGKTVLHLVDLASGAVRPLYDGLDRDMQETWAIHGVYPTMAWTPDGRALVFWAGGRINRLEVGSGALSQIPFHVETTRRVLEPLRFPQQVAPPRFPVRMLRWVQVSPQGDRVVYQALGQLYVRPLPEGTPRRLTRQSDHFELYPSWSRDGRSIVYVAWNDDELGSVRVVPAGGGEGRAITAEPGHYLEPTFSPDGNWVVFRKAAGGFITSPTWSYEPGLYVVPAAGGGAKLLSREGFLPHFGADSDRVYFMVAGEEDKRLLRSIELSGSDERTHLSSEAATELRVSPDGRWVAFTERFNAYIAPFVPTGKTVNIGPDAKALPLAKVSRDAGEYLHWSGDSRRLHWSLGPELYSRGLTDSFAFLDGAPEKLPEPPQSGVAIGFEAEADRPAGTLALVGGRVITMEGEEVIEDGTVLVERDRIVAVGPRTAVAVPPGARVIDVAGKTVLPGLVDVHWHGSQGSEEIVPQRNWFNYASLAFGVTTIHDPSNDTSEIFAAAELARAGLATGPRIFSTGTILYGAKAPFTAVIDSLDDARSHLRRMRAVGAFSVKSYNQPRRDQRQQVIAAARELQMMVVPEGGSLFQHNMTMVVDGHTGVEHSLPVAKIYDDVRQLWSGNPGVGYTPTLIVGYGGLFGEEYWYAKTNVWEDRRLLSFVPREEIDSRSRRRGIAPDEEWNHLANARAARELADRGVPVNVGAHGQREGLGAHWEMWMLAQGGMTPMEALRAATANGARYLGLDGDIGSLKAGKLADLIVIDGDPLADLRVSVQVVYTMLGGRLYDAATMDEVAPRAGKRGRFWWEERGADGPAGRAPGADGPQGTKMGVEVQKQAGSAGCAVQLTAGSALTR
jgi:imidazolonepropionase-like amidohydrolase/Tol biopolymer transport system component